MQITALENKLLAADAAKRELETRLLDQERVIETLEADRRWLADREKEEREAKEACLKESNASKASPANSHQPCA